jgi:hypothetical protein
MEGLAEKQSKDSKDLSAWVAKRGVQICSAPLSLKCRIFGTLYPAGSANRAWILKQREIFPAGLSLNIANARRRHPFRRLFNALLLLRTG